MEGTSFNQDFELDGSGTAGSCYSAFADEFNSLMRTPLTDCGIKTASSGTLDVIDEDNAEPVSFNAQAGEQRALGQPQPQPLTDRPANVPEGTIEPSCSTSIESDYRIRQFLADMAAGNPRTANRHVKAMTELLQEEFDRCGQNTLNWFYDRLQRDMRLHPDSPLQMEISNAEVRAGDPTQLRMFRTQADGTRRAVGTISFQLRPAR